MKMHRLHRRSCPDADKRIAYAQRVIDAEGIVDRAGLAEHPRLYRFLRENGLLERLRFVGAPAEAAPAKEAETQGPSDGGNWSPMGREEYLERARNAMHRAHITKKWQLQARFSSLYGILKEKGLLEELLPLRKKVRDQFDDFPE